MDIHCIHRMGPATVRACVMATVFYFELILERPHSRFNSLSAAALAILVIRPYDLFTLLSNLAYHAWHPS